MAHNPIGRGAAALAAAGLMTLALTAPANARPDEGSGEQHGQTATSQEILPGDIRHAEGSSLSADPLKSLMNHYRYSYKSSFSTPVTPVPRVITVAVDDNSLEYLQVGAGLTGGIALTGAAALALSRRHRNHPNLA
jgi:hypothetical protein